MYLISPSLLSDHPWLLELAVALTGVVGWTTILIGALVGAGLSATASGIKMGVEGDFDAGQFFRDMGIGFGTGGLTAGLGSVIGSIGSGTASAASSAGSNAAAVPVEVGKEAVKQGGEEALKQATGEAIKQGGSQAVQQAAAQAPAGTFGATGTAVQAGAMSPAGASGALSGATSSADLTRSIANMVPDALREAGVPQAQQALTQAGNALSDISPALKAAGMPGPSYMPFQQATSLARAGTFAPADFNIASTFAPTQTTLQKVGQQGLLGTISGGARGAIENPRDWRGPVYGALAGGVSGGLGTGTSASLAPVIGQPAATLTSRVLGGAVGGGIRGLGDDDPGNGLLAGAVSGAAGAGITGGLGQGWKAINPSEPLLPLKEVDGWKGIPYGRDNEPVADFARTLGAPQKAFGAITDYRLAGPGDDEYATALGVRGMKTVENQLTGIAGGLGSSAIRSALRRPTEIIPPLPTSGPAMYAANRSISGMATPLWARSARRF
jgi:hypothetical protein